MYGREYIEPSLRKLKEGFSTCVVGGDMISYRESNNMLPMTNTKGIIFGALVLGLVITGVGLFSQSANAVCEQTGPPSAPTINNTSVNASNPNSVRFTVNARPGNQFVTPPDGSLGCANIVGDSVTVFLLTGSESSGECIATNGNIVNYSTLTDGVELCGPSVAFTPVSTDQTINLNLDTSALSAGSYSARIVAQNNGQQGFSGAYTERTVPFTITRNESTITMTSPGVSVPANDPVTIKSTDNTQQKNLYAGSNQWSNAPAGKTYQVSSAPNTLDGKTWSGVEIYKNGARVPGESVQVGANETAEFRLIYISSAQGTINFDSNISIPYATPATIGTYKFSDNRPTSVQADPGTYTLTAPQSVDTYRHVRNMVGGVTANTGTLTAGGTLNFYAEYEQAKLNVDAVVSSDVGVCPSITSGLWGAMGADAQQVKVDIKRGSSVTHNDVGVGIYDITTEGNYSVAFVSAPGQYQLCQVSPGSASYGSANNTFTVYLKRSPNISLNVGKECYDPTHTRTLLSWAKPAGVSGTISYDVLRNGTRVGGVTSNSNTITYRDSGVSLGGTYAYRIEAYSISGILVGSSEEVSVSTLSSCWTGMPFCNAGSSLTVSPSSETMQVGESKPFQVWFDPDGPLNDYGQWNVATHNSGNSSTAWSSSNSAVATIGTQSSNPDRQNVNGVGSGNATINARYTLQGSFCKAATANVNVTNDNDFTISISPSERTVERPGTSDPYTITVTPLNGFSGSVELSVQGLEAGLSGAISPFSVVNLSGGAQNATMRITAGSSAGLGRSTFSVRGNEVSGSLQHSTSADITVVDGSFPVASITPHTQNVAVGQQGTLNWSCQNSNYGSIDKGVGTVMPSGSVRNASGSETVTVSSTETYTLTCTRSGVGSDTDTATVVAITQPDFFVQLNPDTQTVDVAGGDAGTSYTVFLRSLAGFAGTVNLSTQDLGYDSSFDSVSVPLTSGGDNSTILRVTVPQGTAPQTDSFLVRATSGALSHDAAGTLIIENGGLPPTTSITARPAVIAQGETSQLVWTQQRATTCSIDQGIGEVCGPATSVCGKGVGGQQVFAHLVPVTPSNTTAYTITCTNGDGTADANTTVTVSNGSAGRLNIDAAVSRGGGAYEPLTSAEAGEVRVEVGGANISLLGSYSVQAGEYGPFTIAGVPEGFLFTGIDIDVPGGGKAVGWWKKLFGIANAQNGTATVLPNQTVTVTFLFSEAGGDGLSCIMQINPSVGQEGDNFSFSIASQGGESPYQYKYQFDDGNQQDYSSASVATHRYESAGSYAPRGYAKDNKGAEAVCSTVPSVISVTGGDTCTLTARPTSILRGQSSELEWVCPNPGSIGSCSIKEDVGDVSPYGGSTDVRPSQTTNYELYCDGTYQDNARISVGFLPLIREIIPR